jgi:formiminotetrahydrofolate cyclodeaminase
MEKKMADKSQAALLANIPLSSFIQNVASRSPAPGGGSVAAFAGSLGAALGAMVCRLTIGKKKYKEFEEEMRTIEKSLLPLRDKLRDIVDEDTFAFDDVMAAFDLPKDSEEEISTRINAIDNANRKAAEVPLEVMKISLKAVEYLLPVAEKGNVNSISDVGVAGLCFSTAFEGAKLNVLINIKDMEPSQWKEQIEGELKELTTSINPLLNSVKNAVDERIK